MPSERREPPTEEERMEAPLVPLEPAVRAFAERHGIELVVNDRGWPSRRLKWATGGIERRIDVFLQDEEDGTVAVWAAAWIERDGDRLGRSEWLRERADPVDLAREIESLLEEARRSALAWERDDLEPWAELDETAGWRSIVFLWIPFLLLAAIVIWVVDWILEGLL